MLAINTHPDQPRTAWVDLDSLEDPAGARLTCLYSSAPGQVGHEVTVQTIGDRNLVSLQAPQAGFVIYERA